MIFTPNPKIIIIKCLKLDRSIQLSSKLLVFTYKVSFASYNEEGDFEREKYRLLNAW